MLKTVKIKEFFPLAVLITVVVGSILYIGIKDNKLSPNWNTYSSNLYGFSIQYPSNYVPPKESPINNSLNPPQSGFMQFSDPDNQDTLNIKVWGNPNKLSLQDFIQKSNDTASDAGAPPISPIIEQQIVINRIPAYQSVTFGGDGDIKNTYFATESFIIEISFYESNINIVNQEASKAIFEKMLSSFSLTK